MTADGSWPPWACPADATALAGSGNRFRCEYDHVFSLRDDIPRFVEGETYAEPFGAQWIRYPRVQFDSHTGVPLSEQRLRRCMGSSAWDRLHGAQVLEAGCGAGRFTEILLTKGACVTSIDLSTAVEANAANFPQDGSHRVAQADILALPFQPRQYDIVVCLGVVQHTPAPEATIRALYEHVKPGGWLVFDHYTHTWGRYLRPGQVPHLILRHMSPQRGLATTEKMVDVLLPLHRRAARGPAWRSKVLLRVSPVNSYYHRHPFSEDVQREWALLDTHDHLTDRYKRLRSRRSLRRTVVELGLEESSCERGGNGVEVRGRRPAP